MHQLSMLAHHSIPLLYFPSAFPSRWAPVLEILKGKGFNGKAKSGGVTVIGHPSSRRWIGHPYGAEVSRTQVRTTMIYTHVLNRGSLGVRSPLDTL